MTASTHHAWSRALDAIGVGLAVALAITYGILFALVRSLDPHVFGFPGSAAAGALAISLMGLLVARRQRHNPVGWLMLAAGFSLQLVADAQLYAILAYRGSAAGLWLAPVAAWIGSTAWGPALGSLTLGLMTFPDGRLPSRRWRIAFWSAAAASLAFAIALVAFISETMLRGPIAIGSDGQLSVLSSAGTPPGVGTLFLASFPLLILSFVIGVVALITKTIRATGERRQQMKWFMYAAALATPSLAAYAVSQIAIGASLATTVTSGIFVLTLAALPVATAVAILRYRLYDIDVVISRTLVYGSLAACITAVYVGIAVGFGELVGSGGKPNLGLSILATAIVALGFQPLRSRLQHVANRLVYGKRATPYEALSQFSQRAGESYTLDDVLPRMARVLAEGTGAERATVWLRGGSVLRAAAVWPTAEVSLRPVALNGTPALAIPDATRTAAVLDQQELLGALSVAKRRGESLSPIEIKLMDDLAHQAGLVLKNASLTADLQQRMEDLRASRQRLVAAQDDERRRLERNLHDGAQQHLVALKVKIGLAETLTDRDPEKARATLQQLRSDADEALQTLRELAHGIYPPLLADRGLPAALEAQARRAIVPVTVEADGLGRYPQDVEAAVYFCCLEALQNAQKYAEPGEVRIVLRDEDGALRFDVADNGRGFDMTTTPPGSGLVNMRDRLEALGGSLVVTSRPGDGACVRGSLPVRAAAGVPA